MLKKTTTTARETKILVMCSSLTRNMSLAGNVFPVFEIVFQEESVTWNMSCMLKSLFVTELYKERKLPVAWSV